MAESGAPRRRGGRCRRAVLAGKAKVLAAQARKRQRREGSRVEVQCGVTPTVMVCGRGPKPKESGSNSLGGARGRAACRAC